MTELTHEQQIEARMSLAYREAVEQSNRSALVTIHVGQEVMRVLEALSRGIQTDVGLRAVTFHGFPIVVEEKWATEHIRVCSGKDIP